MGTKTYVGMIILGIVGIIACLIGLECLATEKREREAAIAEHASIAFIQVLKDRGFREIYVTPIDVSECPDENVAVHSSYQATRASDGLKISGVLCLGSNLYVTMK